MKTTLTFTDHAPIMISGTTLGLNASTVSFTVLGQLWSLKNARIPLKHSRRTIMNASAQKFCDEFALQVPLEYRNLRMGGRHTPLRAIVTVFYPSWRQDLDTALLYDLLQHMGVVSNDRWIREHHEYAHVDPKNPRVEIILEEL